ncbi:MAG: hypothetical protein LWY06_07815 [Firmicutes bacterium]|nr:hypothetical protein [Bacillota bacterium]
MKKPVLFYTAAISACLLFSGCGGTAQTGYAGGGSQIKVQSSSAASSQQKAFNEADYDKAVEELFSINLVDSLALSSEQYKKLIPVVEEAGRMQSELAEIRSKNNEEVMATMAQIRKMLVNREPITDNEQSRLNKATWEIDKKIAENRSKLQELVRTAKKILTDNQIVLIDEYQPCITPNRSLCQQDRIGEAKDGWRFQETMERLRKLPEAQYKAEKEKLVEEEETRRKAYYNSEQVDFVVGQMETALDKSRKMDDNEFEMCKIELAKINLPPAGAPKGKNITDEAVARFLLNPGILDLMRKRADEKQ